MNPQVGFSRLKTANAELGVRFGIPSSAFVAAQLDGPGSRQPIYGQSVRFFGEKEVPSSDNALLGRSVDAG